MIDVAVKAKELLAAQPGVVALTSTRITAHKMPEEFEPGVDCPQGIAVEDDGSKLMTGSPLAEANVQITCFGASAVLAEAVARAVIDALHRKQNLTAGGTRWLSTWIEQTSGALVDGETHLDYTVCRLRGLLAITS